MNVRLGLALMLFFIFGSTRSLLADTVSSGSIPDHTGAAFLDFTYTARSSPYAGPMLDGSGWVEIAGDPLTTGASSDDHAVLSSTDPPAYNIVAGEFQFNGETFTLEPSYRPGDYFRKGFYIWGDDIYYPTAAPESIVDGFGLAFQAANGTGNWINLFSVEGAHLNEGSANSGQGFFYSSDGEFSISDRELSMNSQIAPAPEPSSLLLLGTGICGLCLRMASRRVASDTSPSTGI